MNKLNGFNTDCMKTRQQSFCTNPSTYAFSLKASSHQNKIGTDSLPTGNGLGSNWSKQLSQQGSIHIKFLDLRQI